MGCALIRAELHTDPSGKSDEEWADLLAQALWTENRRVRNQAALLRRLFGEPPKTGRKA